MKAIPLDVDEELMVREPTSLSLRELLWIAFREWRDRPPKPRTDIFERGFMLCDNTPPPKSQPHPPSPPRTSNPITKGFVVGQGKAPSVPPPHAASQSGRKKMILTVERPETFGLNGKYSRIAYIGMNGQATTEVYTADLYPRN